MNRIAVGSRCGEKKNLSEGKEERQRETERGSDRERERERE